jgi:hypothetical protein
MNVDRYYLADQEIKLDTPKERQRLTQRIRQYLELRNVSILLGNGCSIPLGSPVLNDTTKVRPEFEIEPYKLRTAEQQTKALALLDLLLPANSPPTNVEAFLGVLNNIIANTQTLPAPTTFQINNKAVTRQDAMALDTLVKKWLYLRCRQISDPSEEKIAHHRELFRRILLRSTSLPRCKVFTSNYDLIIEQALDSLGIVYLDGFTGTIKRTLHSESYHYDFYYPGETTEGRISRVDRVLHFYKVHGSINWRRTTAGSLLDVTISPAAPLEEDFGDVMIYPSPLKATETHGYPYSEMLRSFSAHVNQPQSVLITIGYALMDEHINRLIYQALNVPSFVLMIVVPEFQSPASGAQPGPEHEIWRLINHVKSTRIIVITGGIRENGQYTHGAGTLQDFAATVMPDITELDIQARVNEEARRANESEGEEPSAD